MRQYKLNMIISLGGQFVNCPYIVGCGILDAPQKYNNIFVGEGLRALPSII